MTLKDRNGLTASLSSNKPPKSISERNVVLIDNQNEVKVANQNKVKGEGQIRSKRGSKYAWLSNILYVAHKNGLRTE